MVFAKSVYNLSFLPTNGKEDERDLLFVYVYNGPLFSRFCQWFPIDANVYPDLVTAGLFSNSFVPFVFVFLSSMVAVGLSSNFLFPPFFVFVVRSLSLAGCTHMVNLIALYLYFVQFFCPFCKYLYRICTLCNSSHGIFRRWGFCGVQWYVREEILLVVTVCCGIMLRRYFG